MTDIAVRLAKARAEFNELADFKKVKGDGLKFSYLPIEQAKPLIEQVTSKHEITIIPVRYENLEGEPYTYRYEKKSKYDGSVTEWTFQTADVTFEFIGPEDSIEMTIRAEAQDNSDKCISKLYTMAYKNMVKIVFGFAESPKDDPDATQEEIPAKARRTASNDPFFNNNKNTESSVTKTEESAEQSGFRKAGECRKAINDWLSEDLTVNGSNEIIASYAKEYGQIGQWSAGTCIQCYKELKSAKVAGLREVQL